MKVQQVNGLLQPRLQRPIEWKQTTADVVTVGLGSAAGAFLGPIAGVGLGAGGGAAAQSMLTSDFQEAQKSRNIARQAVVGLAAGLGASALQLAVQGIHPALSVGLGVVVGGATAALLPNRPQTPVKAHWANLETTQAPELWKQGLTGQGVGVAVLDTGADNHPGLKNQIRAFQSFVDDRQELNDAHHHGTAMAGIISGQGYRQKYPAVAPHAELIVLKVADAAGRVHIDKVTDALRWSVENRQRYNIQVINMSFAADPDDDPAKLQDLSRAVKEATDQGMIVVASAGNEGPEASTMQAPAASPGALAVASQDCLGSSDSRQHQISDFSHRSLPGTANPTVAAPGSDWLQPIPGNQYSLDSGTSQAAAALSGVVALWKQAWPELTAAQAREALVKTAVPVSQCPDLEGAGSVRALAGLDYLKSQRSLQNYV